MNYTQHGIKDEHFEFTVICGDKNYQWLRIETSTHISEIRISKRSGRVKICDKKKEADNG